MRKRTLNIDTMLPELDPAMLMSFKQDSHENPYEEAEQRGKIIRKLEKALEYRQAEPGEGEEGGA